MPACCNSQFWDRISFLDTNRDAFFNLRWTLLGFLPRTIAWAELSSSGWLTTCWSRLRAAPVGSSAIPEPSLSVLDISTWMLATSTDISRPVNAAEETRPFVICVGWTRRHKSSSSPRHSAAVKWFLGLFQ